ALVLHPHGPRRATDRRDAPAPAEARDAAGRERSLDPGLRHRRHGSRPGERAGPPGGLGGRLGAGGRPRPGDVPPAGVRGGGQAAWGWRFGGHHVSLNNLVVEGAVRSTTPCFLGTDPATSPLLGGTSLRPLGAVEDLARELVRSLSPGQAARAVLLPRAPSDI